MAYAYCTCGRELTAPSNLEDDDLILAVQEGGLCCHDCDNVIYGFHDDIVFEWVSRAKDIGSKVAFLELELSKSNRRLSRLERMLEEK